MQFLLHIVGKPCPSRERSDAGTRMPYALNARQDGFAVYD